MVWTVSDVVVRGMREADLNQADHVFRLAFGTFLGLPDPQAFAGDSDHVRSRWRAEPSAAFVAELDGSVVGSNLATRWGSVGFFGPLSVRPDLWDRGIARRLLEPVMECFAAWVRPTPGSSRSRRVPSTWRSTESSASTRAS